MKFLILVITSYSCLLQAVIRTSYNKKSNELGQFYRYLNLSGHAHDSHFLIAKCCDIADHGLISECFSQQTTESKSKHLFPSVCGPKKFEGNDCQYSIVESGQSSTYDVELGHLVKFSISQSQCYSKCKISGGSSFDIIAKNDKFKASCGIIDGFNNMYDVTCHLPAHHLDEHSNSRCMNVTVVLDYEHYDAFGMESDYHLVLSNMIVKDKIFCSTLDKKTTLKDKAEYININIPTHEYPDNTFDKGIWMIDDNQDVNNDIKMDVYHWIGKDGQLDGSTFKQCLLKQHYQIQGESHQRYF